MVILAPDKQAADREQNDINKQRKEQIHNYLRDDVRHRAITCKNVSAMSNNTIAMSPNVMLYSTMPTRPLERSIVCVVASVICQLYEVLSTNNTKSTIQRILFKIRGNGII
jgi:hypothetical protein